jgi:hypothetical protein
VHLRYIPAYDDAPRRRSQRSADCPRRHSSICERPSTWGGWIPTSGVLQGCQLTAGASNLFGSAAALLRKVTGVQGYDTSQGDLKGRFWYVRLGKTF